MAGIPLSPSMESSLLICTGSRRAARIPLLAAGNHHFTGCHDVDRMAFLTFIKNYLAGEVVAFVQQAIDYLQLHRRQVDEQAETVQALKARC